MAKTLIDVLRMFPDTAERDWHRHNNGKGWIYKTATVARTAYVGANALVYGHAKVYHYAMVAGDAEVCGYARVSSGIVKD